MWTRQEIIEELRRSLSDIKENEPILRPNFSALERETGISRQTIAKIWNNPYPEKKNKRNKKSKLDPYRDEIRKKFEEVHPTPTMVDVFRSFQENDPDGVFTSYSNFKAYVRKHHLNERQVSPDDQPVVKENE